MQAVISQQLIEKADGLSRTAALEVMVTTPVIGNLIREGKTEQIESAVKTGSKYGMRTMDMALADLYKKGEITAESALSYAVDKEVLKRLMMF